MDDCCKLDNSQPSKIAVCPTCAAKGKPVPKFTVSVMVKDPELYLHPEHLSDGKYFICESKSCPTVYFSQEGVIFSKEQIRVKVWQKEDNPDVPVCYCFHNTVSNISEELRATGGTHVVSRISAEVKAGNCRCEVTNPQGSCCLGNVVKAIRIAREHLPTKKVLSALTPVISTTQE